MPRTEFLDVPTLNPNLIFFVDGSQIKERNKKAIPGLAYSKLFNFFCKICFLTRIQMTKSELWLGTH